MQITVRAKCLILGETCVGKTTFLHTFLNDGSQYLKNYIMTTGVDIQEKSIRIPDTSVAVQLMFYDCSGKEFYRKLILHVSDHPSMVLLFFDVTSEESLTEAENIFTEVQQRAGNTPLNGVLIGTKTDLTSRRRVNPKRAADLAQKLGLSYMEGSAKDHVGVEEPFYLLANLWHKSYNDSAQTANGVVSTS